MRYLKIEILKGGLYWWWRIVSRNGQVLAHSEMYEKKSSAIKSAQRVASSGFKILDRTEK